MEEETSENDHELVRELFSLWDHFNQQRMLETWHDAQQIREEALDRFSLGIMDLTTRAQVERLFWSVAREIQQLNAKSARWIAADAMRELTGEAVQKRLSAKTHLGKI